MARYLCIRDGHKFLGARKKIPLPERVSMMVLVVPLVLYCTVVPFLPFRNYINASRGNPRAAFHRQSTLAIRVHNLNLHAPSFQHSNQIESSMLFSRHG